MNFSLQVLFSSEISRCQLTAYLQILNKENLTQQITTEMKKASQYLNQMIKIDSEEEQIFFTNYQTLISILYETQPEMASNLALHRINIYAQRLIEANNPKIARRVLESVFSYLHNDGIDPLLLSTALNNLSFMYFFQKDYQLSLNIVIQNINFCQQTIRNLEIQKNKKLKVYIQSLAVVLVNSLKLGKQILNLCQKQKFFDVLYSTLVSYNQTQNDKAMIYQQKQHQSVQSLKKFFNKLGFEACIQYLGKDSYFSRFFEKQQIKKKKLKQISIQTDNQESISLVNRKQFNIFQSQTLKKLDNIHEMLKMNSISQSQLKRSEKFEQNIVFMSTKNSQQNIECWNQNFGNNKPQNIDVKFPQKSDFYKMQRNQIQVNIFADEKAYETQQFEMDGWRVQVRLFKTSDQNLGRICFKCQNIKNGQSFTQIINYRDLMKILSLRYFQDVLPYQFSFSQLPQNFVQVCIKPYLSISPEGRIIHLPRARTLTQFPIKIKFLSSQCCIFFFHIRANNFRISISPIEESGSIYLNVQLSQNCLQQLFQQLIDPIPEKIRSLFQDQEIKRINKKVKHSNIHKKSLQIKSQQKLKALLVNIVEGFQHFLSNEEDSMECNDIFGWIQKDQYYWRFQDNGLNRSGRFLRVKFNKYKKSFSIYGQQFEFQNKQRRILNKKGIFEFKSYQFRQVFGFQPQYDFIKQRMKIIEEILSYKYTFKKISDGRNTNLFIQNQESTLRDINFMVERSFNQQSFYVDFIPNQQDSSYLRILTVSVVTLSNIFPVGIKVSLYDPNQVSTKAFFINIFSQNWNYQSYSQQKGSIVNCQSTQILNKKKVMFKSLVQKYPQEQNYFLTYWLKHGGFKIILTKVLDQNSCLYLQKNLNSIVNWQKIFQE